VLGTDNNVKLTAERIFSWLAFAASSLGWFSSLKEKKARQY
jgi:hypothetical protein